MHYRGYKDLIVWQKSVDFVVEIYSIIKGFPDFERFALCQQLRRAVVSIPANIAEGYCRNHKKEYQQFLGIAYGSLAEVETFLEIARRLGYISELEYNKLDSDKEEIRKILVTLIRKLS